MDLQSPQLTSSRRVNGSPVTHARLCCRTIPSEGRAPTLPFVEDDGAVALASAVPRRGYLPGAPLGQYVHSIAPELGVTWPLRRSHRVTT